MQPINDNKLTIGKRLQQERVAAKISQLNFAGIGDVSEGTQRNYEKGRQSPGADYLQRISHLVDVGYIVTGQRDNAAAEPKQDAPQVERTLQTFDPQIARRALAITEQATQGRDIDAARFDDLYRFIYTLVCTGQYGSTAEDLLPVLDSIMKPLFNGGQKDE